MNDDWTLREWYSICSRIKELIAEYDNRYGYLGGDWNATLETIFEEGKPLILRIYFDNDERTDVILDHGEWAPSDWLDFVVDDALAAAKALEAEGRILSILPQHIEFAD